MAVLVVPITWPAVALASIFFWWIMARRSLLTVRLRSSLRPVVGRHVEKGVPVVLRLQRLRRFYFDSLFGLVSFFVSVEFYTVFLPFLFWSGYCRLARQMTLLMASCIYTGNIIKDTVSAPRPPTPPVWRLIARGSNKDSAMEYGLPSSHAMNTICLSGYLLVYLSRYFGMQTLWLALPFSAFVILTGLGRLYLGMHTPIDVFVGALVGFSLLALWCLIEGPLDSYITTGKNVLSFWASLACLLLFAYPEPEQPTPSFQFHTAFNGVAFGVVWGVYRTYWQYHHKDIPAFGSSFGMDLIMKRLAIGFPIIIVVKIGTKELAKRLLPSFCALTGMPIKSSSYVPDLNCQEASTQSIKKLGFKCETFLGCRKLVYVPWNFIIKSDELFDVDTGIRLSQYAALGWSVVELVPQMFELMGL